MLTLIESESGQDLLCNVGQFFRCFIRTDQTMPVLCFMYLEELHLEQKKAAKPERCFEQ